MLVTFKKTPPLPSPLPLEDLLTSSFGVTSEVLEQIHLSHEGLAEKEFLGDTLAKRDILLKSDFIKALCLHLHIPFIEEFNWDEIQPDWIRSLPIHYAKSQEVLPIGLQENHSQQTLILVASNPFLPHLIEDLKLATGFSVEIYGGISGQIQEAINRVYEKSTSGLVNNIGEEFDDTYDLEGPIDILEANQDDAPVIKFVNSLLFRAVKEKASDIHIEPFEKEFVVRFRMDGLLYDIIRQPKRAHAAISSRIKVMGSLDIAEKRLPQDGRIKIKIAGKDIDIRLSTVPTHFGERLVLRILEQTSTILELEQLGFSEEASRTIKKTIFRKYGIILVTGPTGSGKSTTLSACLVKLNSPTRNIMTVEDPIEYQIPGINQVQVNTKIELTFARALRAFLRQNPDIIMVGEIRDKETAEISINASLTGHLVLSTLHTNDAASAPARLIDMGVEPFLVASSLLGIVAQRLIRKVCTKCKIPHEASDFEKQEIGVEFFKEKTNLFRASGCPQCSYSGYAGRMVISEVLVVDDVIRSLIIKNTDSGQIKKSAIQNGMKTLREDGISKVLQGMTTIDELLRATHAEE